MRRRGTLCRSSSGSAIGLRTLRRWRLIEFSASGCAMASQKIIVPRLIQLISYVGGAVCLYLAFFDSHFRQFDGALKTEFCFLLAAGLALILVGATVKRKIRASAAWFALALIGQAAALQMIEAGPYIRYQHYKPIGRLLTWPSYLLLIVLIIQSMFVLVGLKSRWPEISAWLGRNFKIWQLIAIAMVLILPSAAVS